MTATPTTVRAHAGHRGDEEPRAVVRAGEEIAVALIHKRWSESAAEPGGAVWRCFEVELAGGGRCILAHHDAVGWVQRA